MELTEAKVRIEHLEKNQEKISADVRQIFNNGCKFQMGDKCKALEDEVKKIKEKGCGKAPIHEMGIKNMEKMIETNVTQINKTMTGINESIKATNQKIDTLHTQKITDDKKASRNDVFLEIGKGLVWVVVIILLGMYLKGS